MGRSAKKGPYVDPRVYEKVESQLANSQLANSVASEATTSSISAAEVLQGCGFTPVGRSMLRELLVYSGE